MIFIYLKYQKSHFANLNTSKLNIIAYNETQTEKTPKDLKKNISLCDKNHPIIYADFSVFPSLNNKQKALKFLCFKHFLNILNSHIHSTIRRKCNNRIVKNR